MHHHECVCACHLALSYKQGTEHHRNSDAAISHSSPFSLLINKTKAACILYSCRGLSLGAHMKESALTVFCISLPPMPNSLWTPQAHTANPCSGRGASGVAGSPQLGCTGSNLRLSVRSGKTPLWLCDGWQASSGCALLGNSDKAWRYVKGVPCTPAVEQPEGLEVVALAARATCLGLGVEALAFPPTWDVSMLNHSGPRHV